MLYLNREQGTDFLLPKRAFSRRQETSVSCSYAEQSPFYLEEIMSRWNNSNCGFQEGHSSYHTEKSKKRISKTLKEYWKTHIHPMLGTKHTQEWKNKMSLINKGEKNKSWKGGKYKCNGYILIYQPNHPFCSNINYVREHRLIIENIIGRYLQPYEECHHINKIKDDNRPQNLMAFANKTTHRKFEWNKPIKSNAIIFDGRKLDYDEDKNRDRRDYRPEQEGYKPER